MVERISALQGAITPGHSGLATPEPGVILSERRAGAIWQFTAWPDGLAATGATAAAAAGVDAAPGPLRSAFGQGTALLRTEPLRWLLLAEAGIPAPELDPEAGTLLDLGHARTVLRLEGPAAVDLMARMAPIDFRPAAFPDGSVAGTAIHHVGVTVVARGGGFDVLVFRSFGLAMFEHLADSARQFGLEIRA